jgi:transposase
MVITVAKPISIEKRADIVKHMQAGESKENISKWLFISKRTITRVWNNYIETGSYEAKPQNSGRKPKVSEEAMQQVLLEIHTTPDITLLELIDTCHLTISQSALCRRLKKLGFTYKKRHFTQKNKLAQM